MGGWFQQPRSERLVKASEKIRENLKDESLKSCHD